MSCDLWRKKKMYIVILVMRIDEMTMIRHLWMHMIHVFVTRSSNLAGCSIQVFNELARKPHLEILEPAKKTQEISKSQEIDSFTLKDMISRDVQRLSHRAAPHRQLESWRNPRPSWASQHLAHLLPPVGCGWVEFPFEALRKIISKAKSWPAPMQMKLVHPSSKCQSHEL